MKFYIFAISLSLVSIFSLGQEAKKKKKKEIKKYEKVIKNICGGNFGEFVENGVQASPNGCGPEFLDKIGLSKMSRLFIGPELTKCCFAHDVCYNVCVGGNAEKMINARKKCDREMRNCMKRKNKVTAKILYEAVNSLGAKPYLDAKKKLCKCEA